MSKSLQQLVAEIGNSTVIVTHIDIVHTDAGEILRVHCQSSEHPNVLGFIIDLPSEVVDEYDFQDAGKRWKDGWNRLFDRNDD